MSQSPMSQSLSQSCPKGSMYIQHTEEAEGAGAVDGQNANVLMDEESHSKRAMDVPGA